MDIYQTLKSARAEKGLSQRQLAERTGVPQSHISKIETGGVDLRVSSLLEIARALDLEVTLVPRKSVSAVNSIVRSTKKSAPRQLESVLKELKRLQATADKVALKQSGVKEAIQLQSRIRDLARFELPASYEPTLGKLNKALARIDRQAGLDSPELKKTLHEVQALRNKLTHQDSSSATASHTALYDILEDDDG